MDGYKAKTIVSKAYSQRISKTPSYITCWNKAHLKKKKNLLHTYGIQTTFYLTVILRMIFQFWGSNNGSQEETEQEMLVHSLNFSNSCFP